MSPIKLKLRLLGVCLLASVSLSATAQVYKLHNADISGNATGLFGTQTLQSNSASNYQTTNTTGFLFTLRDHPVAWAGVEFNYGYSKYSNRYTFLNNVNASTTGEVKATMHEATGAYVIHPHFRHLQPFVGIGGGAIDFVPIAGTGSNQWRGAGLLEAGLDIPTRNPHLGFRVQGRSLFYRAPNFYSVAASPRSWIAVPEPTAGVYYRF